jgi:hypothetical protein
MKLLREVNHTWSLIMHIKVRRKRIVNCVQHDVGNDEQRDGKLSSESSRQSVARALSQVGGPIDMVTTFAFVPDTSNSKYFHFTQKSSQWKSINWLTNTWIDNFGFILGWHNGCGLLIDFLIPIITLAA